MIIIGGKRQKIKVAKPLSEIGEDFDFIYLWEISQHRILSLFIFPLILAKKLILKDNKLIIMDIGGLWAFFAMFFSKLFKVPFVFRLRGPKMVIGLENYRFNLRKNNLIKSIYLRFKHFLSKLVFSQTERYILVSHWLKSQIPDESSYKVVRTPVHRKYYLEERGISKKKRIFVSVTNFDFPSKVKGLSEFIEKFQPYLKKNDVILKIAGDGVLLEKIKKRFADFSNVEFIGYFENVKKLYKRAEVFIHFSYLDGYPSTVLEAQAARLPVIANNLCGMREQIKDGETGYLVDLNNMEEVKEKLSTLINSEEERRRLGNNGYKKVKKENNMENIGKRLKEAISELLAEANFQ